MSILNITHLKKNYGEKTLFEDVSLAIADGDKIGLIGVNGTGKSTLLKIITGIEDYDDGQVWISPQATIEYLPQAPIFDEPLSVMDYVFKSDHPLMVLVREYEETSKALELDGSNEKLHNKLLALTDEMSAKDAWDLESKVKTILTKLKVTDFSANVQKLSGGQQKRIALAQALINPGDLLILDEPTNHLDHDIIEWLESYLKQMKTALLMITHDRYFLDSVVNKIMELDYGKVYTYKGNYNIFLERKQERKALESTLETKRQRLFQQELAWIRAGVQGRGTKQKARIDRFMELKHQRFDHQEDQMEIALPYTRLGKKIIDIESIEKSFSSLQIVKDFTLTLKKQDRIGIIGPNGSGKSTLLKLITGKLPLDGGAIDVGTTVKFGFYEQTVQHFNPELKAIEYIEEAAEYITDSKGQKVSASQMMERFLFPKHLQHTKVGRLSGGERRRLYLLRVLCLAPNVIILDEPTNDLDIETLTILESYLDDFDGVVITVSHDRYFLDRIAKTILCFEGDGKLRTHVGNYTDYLTYKSSYVEDKELINKPQEKTKRVKQATLKMSYNEKREYEALPNEIELLETKLESIDALMVEYASAYTKLSQLQDEKDMVEMEILEKLERLEYLENLQTQINTQKASN